MIYLTWFWYRFWSILNSIYTLLFLRSEIVDSFLKSYEIYENEWESQQKSPEEIGRHLVNYYQVINHLCNLGQVEKMYIPPLMESGKNIRENQILFEKNMFTDLHLSELEGGKVADLGCGRGMILLHLLDRYPRISGIGVNIDVSQLQCGEKRAIKDGVQHRVEWKHHDLNGGALPFESNSLDAVYEVQVFSLCKDLPKMFREIWRVLKPGARVACLDWVRLNGFEPDNPSHQRWMAEIKPLIGAIGTPTPDSFVKSMQEGGFNILYQGNLSRSGVQFPLIRSADKWFRWLSWIIDRLVTFHLVPRHMKILFDRLVKGGESFVEADRNHLVTTSFYVLAEKPLE